MTSRPAPAPAPARFRAVGLPARVVIAGGDAPAAAAAAGRRAGWDGPIAIETADGAPVLVYGAGMEAAALDALADDAR